MEIQNFVKKLEKLKFEMQTLHNYGLGYNSYYNKKYNMTVVIGCISGYLYYTLIKNDYVIINTHVEYVNDINDNILNIILKNLDLKDRFLYLISNI